MKPTPVVLAVLSIALCLLAGPSPALSAARVGAAPEPVTIAVMLPFSGPAAGLGQSALDGTNLAIKQKNAAGGLLGHPVVTTTWDTQCSAAAAQAAAQEAIVQNGLHYVLGDVCSSGSIAISRLANQHGALQVTPASTSAQVTRNGDGTVKPYTFRACFTDSFQARAAAKFAYDSLAARKAFVMYDAANANGYSKSLADVFIAEAVARGITVATAPYTSGTTDFSSMLSAAAAMQPDVVYLPDYYNVANLVTAQAGPAGVTAPFLGADGWDSPGLNTSTANGDYFTNHDFWVDDPRPEVQTFMDAFQARFGHPPDVVSALAFDSANLMFQSVEAAGTLDPGVVKNRMASTSFRGVTGKLAFDAMHDPVKTVAVYKVMDNGRHWYTRVDLIEPRLHMPALQREHQPIMSIR